MAGLASRVQSIKVEAAVPENIEEATVDLSKLRKDFTDATPYLPSYDQRNLDQVTIDRAMMIFFY